MATYFDGDYWPLNTTLFAEDFKGNNPRYIYYLLHGIDFAGFDSGSAQPSLNRNYIASIKVEIPERAEQNAIAATLKALDDKIAINDRITGTLDELSRSLFRQYFVDPAKGGLPPGWRQGKVADLCRTQYGYTASARDEELGPKFLRVKDINKKNWIEWDSVPYCEIPDADRARYTLSVGDILVARMADPGKSAIVEDETDAIFASYLVRLKTQSLSHSYFIYGFLKSEEYTEYSESMKGGSVQSNMNAKVIVGAKLAIPPDDLLESYLIKILPLRRKLTASVHESRSLAQVRETLLPKLMSGQIRVRDAEKVVEDAVLWTVGCRKRSGKTSSWSGSPSLDGSPGPARTSPRAQVSGSPGTN